MRGGYLRDAHDRAAQRIAPKLPPAVNRLSIRAAAARALDLGSGGGR
jgi:hypothetical protein